MVLYARRRCSIRVYTQREKGGRTLLCFLEFLGRLLGVYAARVELLTARCLRALSAPVSASGRARLIIARVAFLPERVNYLVMPVFSGTDAVLCSGKGVLGFIYILGCVLSSIH